jgi:Sulfatase-modifying factor enzyme 1/NACHT domain
MASRPTDRVGSEAPKRKTKLVSRARKTKIATGGGAAVGGSIKTRGGHFIGRDYLKIIINVVRGDGDAQEARSVIEHYLHVLAADLARLNLNAIEVGSAAPNKEPLQLADVYVPLHTQLQIPRKQTLRHWLERGRLAGRGDIDRLRETRPVTVLEALAEHRELTLLGKPGSGKSTLGASVLLDLVRAWRGSSEELANLGAGFKPAPLPIRVILRRFAKKLADEDGSAGKPWDFIREDMKDAGCDLSAGELRYIQRIARSHGALFLLDGLDECGSGMLPRVLQVIAKIKENAGPRCRFLLTARPYAWPERPDPDKAVYALADLDDNQVAQFIRRWYEAMVERKWLSPGDADRKRGDLLKARRRADLEPLIRSPLLLTLTASLNTSGRLPDDRADLYDHSVDLLIRRWNEPTEATKALLEQLNVPGLTLDTLRGAFEKLAFEVHKENVGRESTPDIPEHRLVDAFCPVLLDSKDRSDKVVEYIENRAGLLIGLGKRDGERQFAFPHRTFQEFLGACYLARQPKLNQTAFELVGRNATWQQAGHWREVLVLAARQAKADRGADLANAMIGSERYYPAITRNIATSDFIRAQIAAEQLLEIGLPSVAGSELGAAVPERVATWLVQGLQAFKQVPEPSRRSQLGDLLARLGDPRFDAERFYLPADEMLGFVRISADPQFRIGTRRADVQRIAKIIGDKVPDNEINDTFTPTPDFYIARYSVTVAQFKAFVEASGSAIGDANALRDPDNRPVRWVSWHEALAYCDWLNQMLATSPLLADSEIARLVRENNSWRVTLPSELEWEKAARGGLSDAVFSWGDNPDPNRANYSDTEIGNTSAVGCFPANGFGLNDMLGNVWEWTRSLWGTDLPYPYDPNDRRRENLTARDEVGRVVRGGSWLYPLVSVRCASRSGSPPDGHYGNLGFRVVLRSAPIA